MEEGAACDKPGPEARRSVREWNPKAHQIKDTKGVNREQDHQQAKPGQPSQEQHLGTSQEE